MSILKKINGLLKENINEKSSLEQDIQNRVSRANKFIDKNDSYSKDILSFYQEIKRVLKKDLLDNGKLSFDKMKDSNVIGIDIESPFGLIFGYDTVVLDDDNKKLIGNSFLEIVIMINDRDFDLAVQVSKVGGKNYFYPVNQ